LENQGYFNTKNCYTQPAAVKKPKLAVPKSQYKNQRGEISRIPFLSADIATRAKSLLRKTKAISL
jgi:hypothetical protein